LTVRLHRDGVSPPRASERSFANVTEEMVNGSDDVFAGRKGESRGVQDRLFEPSAFMTKSRLSPS